MEAASIHIDKLRERRLFVATPMYGGSATGIYTKSIADLSALCKHYGISVRFYFLFNESLIPRARNYCVDEFLRSDATHLMFIDADIGFNANDVITMLAMQDSEVGNDEYDVLAGPYPKKTVSWEKVKQAVDSGFADEDPRELEKFVGDYVFNPVSGATSIPINKPVQVREAGTGFMMIRRNTFDKFKEAYPQQLYLPDHARTEHFDGSREICAYFDCPIDPVSRRYLSEDYMFCDWTGKIGLKTWLLPWVALQHMGSMIYGGTLSDLARIGAAATVDTSKIKNKK